MSVSRSSDDITTGRTGYEHAKHQHFLARLQVVDDSKLDNSSDYDFEVWDVHSVEPAGGLDYNEVAELMGIRIAATEVDLHDPGTSHTARSVLTSEWEISSNSEATALIDTFQNFGSAPFVDTDEGTGTTGDAVSVMQGDEVDDDVYYHTFQRTKPQVFDTTSGSGAGGSGPMTKGPELLDFHNQMDGGPVFDNSDEVYIHGGLDAESLGNNHLVLSMITGTLYWNVQEVDGKIR